MIKLIAVDMDATFLRDDKTYDVQKFKRVLTKIKEQNCLFVIASGNGVSKLVTSFDEEDKQYLIFAGDNGNQIQYQQEILRMHGMSNDTLKRLVVFLSKHPGHYPIVNSTRTNYIFGENPDDALDAFYRYNVSVTKLNTVDDMPIEAPILNVAVFARPTQEQTKQFAKELMQQFPELSAVTSGERWMDVFQAGGGKGAAITYLQEKYGIHPEECIAFGDSLNDLSMMKVVKHSVAMHNADEQLKQVCRYEIGTNNEQSVLDVLEKILNQDERILNHYQK